MAVITLRRFQPPVVYALSRLRAYTWKTAGDE